MTSIPTKGSLFPYKKPHAMSANQVMGHHRMMMQSGMTRESIATSMVNISGGASGTTSDGGPVRESLFEGETEAQRAVVVRALAELQKSKGRRQEDGAEEYVTEGTKEAEVKPDAPKVPQCFLHKKPQKNCKKCQAFLQAQAAIEAKSQAEETAHADVHMRGEEKRSDDRKEIVCSPMLKEQINNSSYYKRLLDVKAVTELIHEMVQSVDTIDVYNPGSKISPSCFMCHVYRLAVFPFIENDLDLIIDSRKSAVVRCAGFLYLRFVTPPMELWDMLEEYLLDDMVLSYTTGGGEVTSTIGEYVESLLTQEKYFDSPLPRLPVKVKQLVEEKVAPMLQHRKRMQANRHALTAENIEDTSVEVNIDGSWMRGVAQGFGKRFPGRLKVRVRLEGEGGNEGVDVQVHIGKIIIADGGGAQSSDGNWNDQDHHGRRHRSRSRSRGRHGGPEPDWSRWKGKSDADMLHELRERNKNQAVCGHGKSYAKRPLNFDASMASTALANPAAEAGVKFESGGPRTSRHVEDDEDDIAAEARFARKRQEEDQRQKMLATVYKKYGAAAPSQSQASAYKEVDTPDMLRLG